MDLAEYIKRYRQINNLTQVELANKLYVTKQTISKWETGKGLPDITMYPDLSKILGVSVDELMGMNRKNQEVVEKVVTSKNDISKKRNLKYLWSLLPSSIIIVILIITCGGLLLIKVPNIVIKIQHISETEKYLGKDLTKIVEYQYINFKDAAFSNSSMFPQYMYYFIFDTDIVVVDDTFVQKLSDETIKYLPSSIDGYLEKCDYFKLVNKDTLKVNEVPNPFDDRNDRYVLYCFQKENNRLIAIHFEI